MPSGNVAPLLSHHAGLITAGLLLARSLVTLSGLANHASESRSNEDPLPDTEDGEKDGDDARGESNVKSSSIRPWPRSGCPSSGRCRSRRSGDPGVNPRGHPLRHPAVGAPVASFVVVTVWPSQTLLDRIANEMETYRENPAAMGRALGGAAGGPSRSSVEDEALSRAGLNGDARRGDHGEHQRGACPERHPIDANLDSDDINHRHPNAECPTERPCPPTLAHPPLHLPNPHFFRLRWCGYVA